MQQAVQGKLPDGLDSRESAAYSLALTLSRQHGPLNHESFEQAKEILGRDGVAGVAHIVGGYIYLAMLSNISGANTPKAGEGMFLAVNNPDLAGE